MTATAEVTIAERPPGWSETWKPVPGFSSYEASDDSRWEIGPEGKPVQVTGGIRSVDRTVKGRFYKGILLRIRLVANSGGYGAVNLTDDQGVQHKGLLVHRVILLTHAGECPRGMETRHLRNDPLDCRWAPGATDMEVLAAGGNIMYGDRLENAQDQFRNGRRRAEPKPERRCVCCDAVMDAKANGKRCHPCVVSIGQRGADLLWSGMKLDKACEELDYPSEAGLHTLAVRYGGYGRPSLRWKLRRWLTRRNRRGASQRQTSRGLADGDAACGGDSA